LGKYTAQASGIFMMMVVGGGVIPFVQEQLVKVVGYMPSYWLIVAAIGYMFFYSVVGSKNVNKDIKVD
jgi:FHS family L-fucose permease-like MFS transporter